MLDTEQLMLLAPNRFQVLKLRHINYNHLLYGSEVRTGSYVLEFGGHSGIKPPSHLQLYQAIVCILVFSQQHGMQ
jgi:hypothetical protein